MRFSIEKKKNNIWVKLSTGEKLESCNDGKDLKLRTSGKLGKNLWATNSEIWSKLLKNKQRSKAA